MSAIAPHTAAAGTKGSRRGAAAHQAPLGERPLLLVSPSLPEPAATRAELVAEAGRRGLNVVTVAGGERAAVDVAQSVESWRADALAVCGTPELQAAAASIAAGRDLPFACVASRSGDRLARDLDAWLASADAPRDPWMDLGEVNGIPFVNQVAIGVHVAARAGVDGARSATLRVRARSPVRAPRAHAVVVLNNADSLDENGVLERRARLDGGALLVAERRRAASEVGWRERRTSALELAADAAVIADVDGVTRTLTAPMRFRLLARAVRVRTLVLDAGVQQPRAAEGVAEVD